MKSLVIVIFFEAITLAICFTDVQKELIAKEKAACLVETGVDPQLIVQVESGDWNVDDLNLKKWFECMMKKSGLLSADGLFQVDVALSKVSDADKPELKELVSPCVKDGLTGTELAWSFSKCYLTKNPKHSIFF